MPKFTLTSDSVSITDTLLREKVTIKDVRKVFKKICVHKMITNGSYVIHPEGYSLFQTGVTYKDALEKLASSVKFMLSCEENKCFFIGEMKECNIFSGDCEKFHMQSKALVKDPNSLFIPKENEFDNISEVSYCPCDIYDSFLSKMDEWSEDDENEEESNKRAKLV